MSDDDPFEDDDLGLDDDGFDGFNKKDATLADMWRDNPMVKIGIIGGVVVAIFGTIMFMGGSTTETAPSMVPQGSEVSAAPTDSPVSPKYRDEIEQANDTRLEKALDSGGGFFPTPIETPLDTLSNPKDAAEEEDPLQRWRRLQEERVNRELRNSQNLAPPTPAQETGRNQAITELSGLMAEQMQAILEGQKVAGTKKIDITNEQYLASLAEEKAQEEAAALAAQNANAEPGSTNKRLVPAGEILYAQLLTEANSDNPGPVLAEIMVGPLAGSRVIGDFAQSEAIDVLTLNFDTVVYKGESVDIDGIALDPNTSLPGLASYVDNKYFQRIVLPAAVTFVRGVADAAANTGLTTITVNGEAVSESSEEADSDQKIASGLEEATQEIANIIEEENQDIQPLIVIEAGTPFGLLLLEAVDVTVSEDGSIIQPEEPDQTDLETLTSGL